MKRCANCEEPLPVELFTSDARRPDGRCPYCKVCAQMRSFLYYRRNRVEFLEKCKAYAQRRPEVNRAARRKYASTPKAKELKRVRGLRRTPEMRHQEYLANRETVIQRSRQWRADNPGATGQQLRNWAAKYPDRYKASCLNHRALRAKASGRLDENAVAIMLDRQEGRCAYCRIEVGEGFHVDHIVPLVRGGEHTLDNCCIACARCNLRKNSKTAEEFLREISQQV